MTPTTDRAAFEAELRNEEEWGHCSFGRHKNGNYKSWRVAFAWSVWQVATSAERERAAKVCQTESVVLATRDMTRGALHCAAAIRSGVDAPPPDPQR